MNRLAVVLAADSATTVTEWTQRGKEERYFKGANKIFQLSDHQPVGLMIFDSAEIMRVPWETVVKSFRNQLSKKSFNTLKEYALEFFAFLATDTRLFPLEVQKSIFLDNARAAAIRVTHRPDDFISSDEVRSAENDALMQNRKAHLDSVQFAPQLTSELYENVLHLWQDELIAKFEAWSDQFARSFPTDMAAFAELGMLEVFKNPADNFGATGLVIAGFGDHDIFPQFVNYKSCGVVCGKHISYEISESAITHDFPASLASFAQTAMSDTFSLGVSEDVYGSLMVALDEGLVTFARQVAIASGGNPEQIPNLEQVLREAREGIGTKILERAQIEHAMPMRRVIGVLPVDEMAELAETLINLQSLKEKVTKDSSSVGGPVDVAIITKNEGMVWVKRKHFFDIALNSRYLARQQARLS